MAGRHGPNDRSGEAGRERGDAAGASAPEPIEAGIASWIRRHEFEVPGILLAESIKPVAWMLAQTVHFFTPHLDIASYMHPALRESNVAALAGFLEDRDRLERFIQELERSARERARRPSGKGT